MRLLGSTEKVTARDKNGETVPKLEIPDVILMHCNVPNNSFQKVSKVLFTFVPDIKFGQLITIAPHSLIILKTSNAEFLFVEIWFTDQNNRPLEIFFWFPHGIIPFICESRKYGYLRRNS